MEAVQIQDTPYTFRPYVRDDIPFIQNSWGRSYYTGGYGNTLLSLNEFHAHHRPIREQILEKPNIAIIVCCSKQESTLIIGYVIVEKPEESPGMILHYLYVKQDFKSEGIGKELLFKAIDQRPVLYTHKTIVAGKILSKFKDSNDLDRFIYCPHLI